MFKYAAALVVLTGFTAAQAPAQPVVASVTDPVNVTSDDPPAGKQYVRDSGYLGVVGDRQFTMNFDTSLCNADETTDCVFIGTNTFTDQTSDPAIVHDPPNNTNLCNTADQLGWVTNVWGVNSTHGVGYYLNITHGVGTEVGQGSSPIIMDTSNDTPVCTRINGGVDFWTQSNHALYGNGGSINASDGYLYAYGSANSSLYVARVLFNVESVSTLSAYTYWNGASWSSEESDAVSILTTMGGFGSVFYSNHYNGYFWLDEALFFAGIYGSLADVPQGPFSNATQLFTDPRGTYAPYALPQYDATGQTVVIKYSVADNLSQRVRTVTWGN